jgi:hypothetical protein
MMEVMTEECSKCDLKELVQKFIPEMISTAVSRLLLLLLLLLQTLHITLYA